LVHLKKISNCPAFDKLWICILNAWNHFLDVATHGSGEFMEVSKIWGLLDDQTKSLLREVYLMITAAREHLQRMLNAVESAGIFQAREGLRRITIETMLSFDGCDDLVTILKRFEVV
jgi:predicted membrane chloride channel (bestrophin family)